MDRHTERVATCIEQLKVHKQNLEFWKNRKAQLFAQLSAVDAHIRSEEQMLGTLADLPAKLDAEYEDYKRAEACEREKRAEELQELAREMELRGGDE